MNDQSSTPKTNSEGIFKAAMLAMLKMDKLSHDQKVDLVTAAFDAAKTALIDDLTHNIGIGRVSDTEVVARLASLGADMEEIRSNRISRFANLCEMLKPECDIEIKIVPSTPAPAPASMMMPNDGTVN